MKYFAYGSNMSISRLKERTPSAISLGCHLLKEHDLRFHKLGQDGSAKCDAFLTRNEEDVIYGVLFEINHDEKIVLDEAEGLGRGYDEKKVKIINSDGLHVEAITYIATNIDHMLRPFTWYVNHVLVGAKEAALPVNYIEEKILKIEAIEDNDHERDYRQRAIHR